ncbi:MAG TPA: M13 family metallopeptidase [Lysobacter sp.]|nr:M13 family metallopeptidase [Lysobacter sp.]
MIQRPLACALAVALLAALAAPDADAQRRKRSGARQRTPAVAPACTDFYAFANADWLRQNTLLPGAGAVSALEQLAVRAHRQQIELLDAAMRAPATPAQQQFGAFWASGLDEAAIERAGLQPIAPLLARVDAIRRPRDVTGVVAALHQAGIPVLFDLVAEADLQQPERVRGHLRQGGLGLPDPGFYTRTDTETRNVLARYTHYVQKLLELTGSPAQRAAADAQQVLDLETRIAQRSRAPAQLREAARSAVPVTPKELGRQYRHLRLADFLKTQGVAVEHVVLDDPALFAQLDALVGQLKPEQWKLYLRARVADAMAPYLTKPLRDAHFDFRGRVLLALPAPPGLAQQTLDAANRLLGPVLGREYAARHLPEPQRQRAETIAQQVREQLLAALARDPRLAEPAKAQARARIESLTIEIGAPRAGDDAALPAFDRANFGANVLAAAAWRQRHAIARIGRPAPPAWGVLPHEPALAYDAAHHRLLVTAAMLQAPVLDPAQEPAAHYGALGALVGHELSRALHPRVNAGAPIDPAWDALAARVAAQYHGRPYPGLTGVNLDGPRVREVGLGDFAGLELAWAAFQTAQPGAAAPARQAFFRGWAGLWAQHMSREVAQLRAATAVHPPGMWRTNVPLMQQPAFGETFACKPGTPMQLTPAQAVRVWP